MMAGPRPKIRRRLRFAGKCLGAAKKFVAKQMRQCPAQQAITHARKEISAWNLGYWLGTHQSIYMKPAELSSVWQ